MVLALRQTVKIPREEIVSFSFSSLFKKHIISRNSRSFLSVTKVENKKFCSFEKNVGKKGSVSINFNVFNI